MSEDQKNEPSAEAEAPVAAPAKFLLRTGKPHISFSELKNWQECSYRHKLQHIDKVSLFKSSYHLVFGSAVHEAIEHYLNTREVKPEIAHAYIDKHWQDDFSDAKDKGFSKDVLKQQATEILTEVPLFLDAEFPGWELVAAEQSLYEAIDSKGAKFKGFIDCIIRAKDKRGKDVIWILDWKTSGSGWTPMKKQDPITGLQLTLYKNFWLQKQGDPELGLRDVRCGFVILKRKGKPGKKCELFKVSVGEVTLTRGLKLVNNMLMSLDRGVFIKNRNSCSYCEFKDSEHCT